MRNYSNSFQKRLLRLVGLGKLTEYPVVPYQLDHPVPQPEGVTILLHGKRDNCNVIFKSSQGSFSFSQLAPEGTKFKVRTDDDGHSFKADKINREVDIPSAKEKLESWPVYGLLHEIGHIWSGTEKIWLKKLNTAYKVLEIPLLSREIFEEVDLPDEEDKRITELQAWQILGDEEQRAVGSAIYIYGRLKEKGIDVLPHIHSFDDLTKLINVGLRSHDQFKQRFLFDSTSVEQISNGELPWPFLRKQIDRAIRRINL